MKKKLDVDKIQSELREGSAFFPGYKRDNSSQPEEPIVQVDQSNEGMSRRLGAQQCLTGARPAVAVWGGGATRRRRGGEKRGFGIPIRRLGAQLPLPLFRSAVPRPSHQETPESSAACLLSGLARRLIAAPRRAASRFGKQSLRAGGAGRPQGLARRKGRR
jgi:hypothetical protein